MEVVEVVVAGGRSGGGGVSEGECVESFKGRRSFSSDQGLFGLSSDHSACLYGVMYVTTTPEVYTNILNNQ